MKFLVLNYTPDTNSNFGPVDESNVVVRDFACGCDHRTGYMFSNSPVRAISAVTG